MKITRKQSSYHNDLIWRLPRFAARGPSWWSLVRCGAKCYWQLQLLTHTAALYWAHAGPARPWRWRITAPPRKIAHWSGYHATVMAQPTNVRRVKTYAAERHAVVLYAMRLNFGKSHCTILVGHMMMKNFVTINCMLLLEYYTMLFCITEMQSIAQYLLKQLASCLHYANDSNDIAITSSRNATVNIDGCLPSNRISRI